MSDPVADKSGFLRMYMANHPDTLVAYAKWFGQLNEAVTGAEMSAIDSKSMTLICKLKGGSQKVVQIPLEPPLSGYEEVKPRLLAMKSEAEEKLNMTRIPQIRSFRLPLSAAWIGSLLLLLCYCTFSPRGSISILFRPANAIVSMVGDLTLKLSWGLVFITHPLESIYVYTLCRKHRTGFITGAAYVITTMVFGGPILFDMRKRIHAARIESMKTK